MKECPECGSTVDGIQCPKCGYTESPNPGNKTDWWRCSDTDPDGNRCTKPGSISAGTHGTGPWYCPDHFPPWRKRGYEKTAPPGGFRAFDDVFRRNRIPNDGSLIE